METQSFQAEIAYFHCPQKFCSAVACIFDVDGQAVKLICPLRHMYWLPISELRRVTPYWPGIGLYGVGANDERVDREVPPEEVSQGGDDRRMPAVSDSEEEVPGKALPV